MTSDGFLIQRTEYEGLCTTYTPTKERLAIPHKGATFSWKGGKIPLSLWRQAISFFLWSFDTYKAEALVQLFYNTETRQWAVWAFPQRGVGLSVSHRENDPVFNEDRKKFPEPWVNLGSIHHHCNIKAFASGTDQEDELKKEGLHITVGELDKTKFDLHMRISFQGVIHDSVDIAEWFDVGESAELGHLSAYGTAFIDWALRMPVRNIHTKEWQDRFRNTYEYSQGTLVTGGYGPGGQWGFTGQGFTQGAAGATGQTVTGMTTSTASTASSGSRVQQVRDFDAYDKKITAYYKEKAGSNCSKVYEAYRLLRVLHRQNLLGINIAYAKNLCKMMDQTLRETPSETLRAGRFSEIFRYEESPELQEEARSLIYALHREQLTFSLASELIQNDVFTID